MKLSQKIPKLKEHLLNAKVDIDSPEADDIFMDMEYQADELEYEIKRLKEKCNRLLKSKKK